MNIHLRDVGSIAASPVRPAAEAPEHLAGPRQGFEELDVFWEPARRTLWTYMNPKEAPSFTVPLLAEVMKLPELIKAHSPRFAAVGTSPQYFVGGSNLPGIFNFGGHLQTFIELIRNRDVDSLRQYAYSCIDVCHSMNIGLGRDLTSVALVQGDALGGGFEAALSFNFLVAEKQAVFGLPEVLFNLFPGMGAQSFLSRRIGFARALRMIAGGETFSADEMHRQGIVDVVAEPGEGHDVVRALIDEDRRQRSQGLPGVLRRPDRLVPYEELREIVDVWVTAALALGEPDLRKMHHLVYAQGRRTRSEQRRPATARPHLVAAE